MKVIPGLMYIIGHSKDIVIGLIDSCNSSKGMYRLVVFTNHTLIVIVAATPCASMNNWDSW